VNNEPKIHDYLFTITYLDGSTATGSRRMTAAEQHEHQLAFHKRDDVRSVAYERLS
jgi:hypothetical protein